MTNLETYKKDIEYYIQHQDYTLVEALEQIYDDYSNQKRIYPKSMDDISTMVKQDIRVIDWLAKGVDKGKRNNLQKHLKEIKELIKEVTIIEAINEVYWRDIINEINRSMMEQKGKADCDCEEVEYDLIDHEMELLNWLLEEVKC